MTGQDEGPVQLLEIEGRLRADADGQYAASLLEQIGQARIALKRYMDKGVSVEEYRNLSRVLLAYDAAEAVVNKVSARYRA
ncbi:EscE/YscE/SsaE family type III secretion system needle protein co-chaperone [Telmatospirillum sp. J64-1]|uniref:EscE/YscE/SsaE family type III secretion system needle protein co-chaperone n=1 Tax=Telmatospirillum sp. J64-1 TaxID=2502183 RepID=UPI00115D816C|nr:EscE/YscE/SsaE family type III secretion system needle protein co-chaperone [Telmatospirillum sp. J64-1]